MSIRRGTLAAVLVVCAACSESSAEVTVGLTSVAFPLLTEEYADEIVVRVRAPGQEPLERVFKASRDPMASVDIEVAPAKGVEFTVIGRRLESDPPMPVLWGHSVFDVVPGDNELEVVVDPAGAVAIRLEREDGASMDQRQILELIPLERESFAVVRTVVVSEGRARIPLVVGTYAVAIDEDFSELTVDVAEGDLADLRWCAPEGRCEDDTTLPECLADQDCDGDDVCVSGACAPPPPVDFGAKCSTAVLCARGLVCVDGACVRADSEDCDSDDECAGSCVRGVCEEPGAMGSDCDSKTDCRPPTVCGAGGACIAANSCANNSDCTVPGETCVSGVCEVAPDLGGECDESSDCRTGVCERGVCIAELGNQCISNKECPDACIDGACAPFSNAGEPCDGSETDDCAGDLLCKDSSCVNRDGCRSDFECGGLETCVREECQPFAPVGRECDSDRDCQEGLSCIRSECQPTR
ncbi:MAG: hypothetical protein AAFU77_04665 [Myxococcota bacterium]